MPREARISRQVGAASGASASSAGTGSSHSPRRPASVVGSWPPTSTAGSNPTSPPWRRCSASSAARPRSTAATWGHGASSPPEGTTFTVRASQVHARRWARVARYLRCRSVSAWLEELADEQARRVEELIPPRRE
jgi:hypothetical protein